eukprot:scaffold62601_cov28-Tisochrysis_lutea.AAC.6
MGEGEPALLGPHGVLEAVAINPALQREHVLRRDLIDAAVAAVPQPRLRQKMAETFAAMLHGKGPSFSVLEGERVRARAQSGWVPFLPPPPLLVYTAPAALRERSGADWCCLL